jgi:hypothetical protein
LGHHIGTGVRPYKSGCLTYCVPMFREILLNIIPKIKRKNRLRMRIYARVRIFWNMGTSTIGNQKQPRNGLHSSLSIS